MLRIEPTRDSRAIKTVRPTPDLAARLELTSTQAHRTMWPISASNPLTAEEHIRRDSKAVMSEAIDEAVYVPGVEDDCVRARVFAADRTAFQVAIRCELWSGVPGRGRLARCPVT
jgi:hypothetical protein